MSESHPIQGVSQQGGKAAPQGLLAWLQLMRAPNSFTAMSNILAAQFIVSGGRPDWHALTLLVLASVCLYTGGIVLNDCFDIAEDRRERPSRPLPSGRIGLATAFRFGGVLLGIGVACAALVGLTQAIIAGAIALLVLMYDGYTKRTSSGPMSMAACRYGNWLLGLSYGGDLAVVWPLGLPVFSYIMALTVLSRAETHAAQRAPLFLCAGGVAVTAAIIVTLVGIGLLPHTYALGLLAVGLAIIGLRLAATWRDYSPSTIQTSVKVLVLGVIPLDALLAFAGSAWWGGLAVLLLLVPSTLLARKIYVT